MARNKNFLTPDGRLDLSSIHQNQQKPAPFTPGEPLFWDDPYISKQLLAAHLDPTIDRASRKPETIEASVAWIVGRLGLKAGNAVLDLGCGPGLYASRLAARGLLVTGVDYSRRSIAYARDAAARQHLDITYRNQNYLTLEDVNSYDAALLIFGDYCSFNPDQRRQILSNVHRALKPGGYFVLDVSTRLHREKYGAKNRWEVHDGGFWRPGYHLVLEQGFDYPEDKVYLDQYIVIEANGEMAVYRNWFQDFDPEMIQVELQNGRFATRDLYSDLVGTPFTEDSEWIGLVAKSLP